MTDDPNQSNRRFQAELEAIFEAAVDGIIIIDARGRIEVFSKAAEHIFGYRSSEVVGENVSILMSKTDRDNHDTYMHNYLTTGEKKIIGIGREVIGRKKDGTLFPIDLAVGEIQQDGSDRRFLGILRDITSRKETEDQHAKDQEELRLLAERLARVGRVGTMGAMTTGIAHEINQPLTAIASYSQAIRRLLQNDGSDKADIVSAVEKIGDQAVRAGEIIKRLRDFVRQRDANRETRDLSEVVRQIIPLAEVDAHENGVTMELSLEDGLPAVRIESVQIQQVVLNLMRNGMEAMRDTPMATRRLIVKTFRGDEATLQLDVRDRGTGISGEIEKELFNPYVTTKEHGLGMGLSICKTIIRLHGGKLWFTRNDDFGLTFHFTLPIAIGPDTLR